MRRKGVENVKLTGHTEGKKRSRGAGIDLLFFVNGGQKKGHREIATGQKILTVTKTCRYPGSPTAWKDMACERKKKQFSKMKEKKLQPWKKMFKNILKHFIKSRRTFKQNFISN